MTTCPESTDAAERPTFVKNAQQEAVHRTLFFSSSPENNEDKGNQSSLFFFATTVYDIYIHNNFPTRVTKEEKWKSIIQQRCRLARIRLETFYLQLEVPNLRVRIAQLGVEPIIIILQNRRGSRGFAVLQTKNTINIIDF